MPPLQSSKPEVALEWSDVTIKFRVMSSPDAEEFDLYPNLDVSAPSARSVIMQQRLHKRKQGTYTLQKKVKIVKKMLMQINFSSHKFSIERHFFTQMYIREQEF